jgi:SAM-dependent methyltransferase
MADSPTSNYALGSTDAEHERLIRQAARIDPIIERFFCEAGIGPGQRVLDLGSGVGDVALLVGKLVGPSGEVVGVERDPRSIARARARVAEAGLRNVTFTQSDVSQIPSDALEQTQRLDSLSIASFRRRDCRHQLCRWRYRLGTIQISSAGCTT